MTLETTAPVIPGAYRLVAIARDEGGSIGPRELPLLRRRRHPDGQPMPFRIDNYYTTTGFMGASGPSIWSASSRRTAPAPASVTDSRSTPPPISVGRCRVAVPCEQLGLRAGPRDRSGGEYVEFLAWSDKPGTRANFFVGSADADGFSVSLDNVELNLEPTYYQIPLKGSRTTKW